jgi:transglutaminase-like putative cysteine protease
VLVVLAWLAQMAWLVHRSYGEGATSLTADLARYSGDAQWRGIYYRGEKLGFSVGQTRALPDGFELQEDGRLQMLLLGSSSTARLRTTVRVDSSFNVRDFEFSLDPGTGPLSVKGSLAGRRLQLETTGPAGSRQEVRDLPEAPVLSLSLPRRLVALRPSPGQSFSFQSFDPVTLRNAPLRLVVQAREVIWVMNRPIPTLRVELEFQGLTSRSWITEVGEVVKEESPTGLLVLRESRDRATMLAVPGEVQVDLLEGSAVQPRGQRIVDPTVLDRLKLRFPVPPGFESNALDGDGQSRQGDVLEIVTASRRPAGPAREDLAAYLSPETLIESDDPAIVAESRRALEGVTGARQAAERLVRHVHALLVKKPTLSLPSAREVLRARVGDCNEHTTLYVALARAAGLPARIAVGLVFLHGSFFYHAWPEVWIAESPGRGLWVPVDPTLGQFPADVSHLRLLRGGLDQQARILGLVGRATIDVLEIEREPGSVPVLVGDPGLARPPLPLDIPRPTGGRRGCWSAPR